MNLRPLTAAFAAVALASCIDVSGPSGRASLAIVPRLSQSASLASATLAEVGVAYDAVRIVIVRPATDTLKDTTIAFSPTSAEVTLDLTVATLPGDSVEAVLQFKQGNTVIFSGSKKVKTIAPTAAAAVIPVEVLVDYTGPGATANTVSIEPGPGRYSANSNTQFTAKAFDGTTELPNTPIFWSVSDESKASISTTGLLQPTGQRGTIELTARAANGISKTIEVQLAPAATGIRVIRGAGQKGPPGSALPLKVAIELVGPDGLPAAGTGQAVTFAASPGASISPASTTLDANGQAEATMTVGNTPGTTYIYTATVGVFSTTWGGSAEVGAPTQLVPSGSTNLVLTAGVVPDPVPTLRVADAQGNSVPGVFLKVTIQNSGGTNVVPPFNVPADSIGLLEVYKVAPTLAGNYTVKVETINVTPTLQITYNVTINPGPAAKLVFTQQPPATVANGQTVTIKVTIQDDFGNTVTSTAPSNVNLAVPAGQTGWNISGTGSVAPVSGVATFSIQINNTSGTTRNSVKLEAVGANLPAVLSSAFNISP